MSSYLDPIRRFPWLVVLALPLALLAGMLVLYEVQWGSGSPTLRERNQPTYQATVQLLVNNSANPYLRSRESPAGEALLDAANYLPFIIESDRVAAIRDRNVGLLPGEVTAQALFARETNRGLNSSPIPIILVTGFASTSGDSIRITQGTIDAFIEWLTAEQSRANVAPGGRILVERLRSPTVTVDKKSSNGLAMLVFVVVLLGFAVLAWVLDRALPRKGSAAAGEGESPGSGRERKLEPALSPHGSAVVSVAGEPAALALDGSPVGLVAGDRADRVPDPNVAHPVEESEPEPASRRRWA